MEIRKGQANNVVLTLTEKTTITNPTYLFELVSMATHKTVCFIAADTSSYTDRFNYFTITEKASPDLSNGECELNPVGTWEYTVYAQEDADNLEPLLADEIVETGIVDVRGTDETINEYDTAPDTIDV